MSSISPVVFKVPSTVNARKYKYFYPNTSPIIYSLSTQESVLGDYTLCYINGLNFSKENTTGNSTVTFGSIKNIPVTFYSSLNLSFVVPNNLPVGKYQVQVVNNNYFPSTTYSNTLEYNCIAYPIIYTLSPLFSIVGVTTNCFISGANFSNNSLNGFSTVTFGNVTNISVIFYNNSSISFQVPTNLPIGTYNVQVVNSNNHFNNYSNSISYDIITV